MFKQRLKITEAKFDGERKSVVHGLLPPEPSIQVWTSDLLYFFIVFVFVFVFLLDPVEHSQRFSSYFYFPLHNFPKLLRNNYSNLWLYLILAFYRTSQRIMSASEKNIALCVLQIGKTI